MDLQMSRPLERQTCFESSPLMETYHFLILHHEEFFPLQTLVSKKLVRNKTGRKIWSEKVDQKKLVRKKLVRKKTGQKKTGQKKSRSEKTGQRKLFVKTTTIFGCVLTSVLPVPVRKLIIKSFRAKWIWSQWQG